MAHDKSPRSYRLNTGPVRKSETDTKIDAVEPCKTAIPTPVDCLKYGIPLEKAKIMKLNDLTLADYLYLRKMGGLNKQKIRGLYGFENSAAFYNKLRDIGAFPEPGQTDEDLDESESAEPAKSKVVETIAPHIETELPRVIEADNAELVKATIDEPVSTQYNPQKPLIITKHICPVCNEEYDVLADAETCLDAHAWIASINKTDGLCAFNCPAFVYVNMNDGRIMKYVAYGFEEDEECSQY